MNDIKNFYQCFGKAIGTTDTVTACDCCGRENLKKTVVFEFNENEYNDEGTPFVYGYRFLGSQCAFNIGLYSSSSTQKRSKIKNTKIDTDFLKPAIVTAKNPNTGMELTLVFKTDFHCYKGEEMVGYHWIKQIFDLFRFTGDVDRFCKYFEKQYLDSLI